jgi:hypothetical protein
VVVLGIVQVATELIGLRDTTSSYTTGTVGVWAESTIHIESFLPKLRMPNAVQMLGIRVGKFNFFELLES